MNIENEAFIRERLEKNGVKTRRTSSGSIIVTDRRGRELEFKNGEELMATMIDAAVELTKPQPVVIPLSLN
jgi:hypothetical protein